MSRANAQPAPSIGFWRSWAMSVGVMIGSGIFLLPALLAPYGSISLVGWVVTSLGVILLSLIFAKLANQTLRTGGPYVYAQEAFGNLPGFLVAWGYWLSVIFAVTAISTAFAGYLSSFIPALVDNTLGQLLVAFGLIWFFTLLNTRGVAEAATVQIILTIAKLLPLVAIIVLGATSGSLDTLPPFNPTGESVIGGIAATALLTMWAFIGIEAAVIPAGDVINPTRTIPRAVVAAAITAAVVYLLVTVAVMVLVPQAELAESQTPLIEAARLLGPFGAALIGLGALVSTAGSLNGNVFLSGQMPMAVAIDKLAPAALARRNAGNAPWFSLILSSALSSALLLLNASDNLLDMFTFLISMSTLCILAPYGVAALAVMKHSWRSARLWLLIALLTAAYTVLAAAGSGIKVLLWGLVLFGIGVPLYFVLRREA